MSNNFTVKDSANADVLFTAVASAAGPQPSVWFAKAKGSAPAFQPKIQLSSSGRPGNGRNVKMTLAVPVTVTDPTGALRVLDTEFYEIRKVGPGRIPALQQADAVAYLANALDVPEVRNAFRDGFVS